VSVIEDTRKLIQDFLAPELHEIATKLDSLERRMDQRIESSDRHAADRYSSIMQAIAQLSDVTDLKVRLARIEARERAS